MVDRTSSAQRVVDDVYNGEVGTAMAGLHLREVLAEIWEDAYRLGVLTGGGHYHENPYRRT